MLEGVVELKDYIAEVPDFPRPGILFRDITPLLKEPAAFREAVVRCTRAVSHRRVDAIAGIEARGFLFAAPLAHSLDKPLIPVRKEGKLPAETYRATYALEYGEAVLEVHRDAIAPGQRVLVVDDVLATGGTLAAAARLVERSGGTVSGFAVLIELVDLKGRDALLGYEVMALLKL